MLSDLTSKGSCHSGYLVLVGIMGLVPMPRPAYVYPADCAFADERYVRTASDVAPFFKLAE